MLRNHHLLNEVDVTHFKSATGLHSIFPVLCSLGQTRLANKPMTELKELFKYRRRNRGDVTSIATRLAISRNHDLIVPKWLAPTQKDKLPKSERVAFPKPPKGPGKLLVAETVRVLSLSDSKIIFLSLYRR